MKLKHRSDKNYYLFDQQESNTHYRQEIVQFVRIKLLRTGLRLLVGNINTHTAFGSMQILHKNSAENCQCRN